MTTPSPVRRGLVGETFEEQKIKYAKSFSRVRQISPVSIKFTETTDGTVHKISIKIYTQTNAIQIHYTKYVCKF